MPDVVAKATASQLSEITQKPMLFLCLSLIIAIMTPLVMPVAWSLGFLLIGESLILLFSRLTHAEWNWRWRVAVIVGALIGYALGYVISKVSVFFITP